MNKRKLHVALVTTAVLAGMLGLRCNALRAYERKAGRAFEAGDYTSVLAYHKFVLKADSLHAKALYQCGISARQLSQLDLAEHFLSKFPDPMKTGPYADTDFLIADVKKDLGKYDAAILFYQKYIAAQPDAGGMFLEQAKNDLAFCMQAIEAEHPPARVNLVRLGDHVNTLGPDLAPFRFGDKIFFTSPWREDAKSPYLDRIYAAIKEFPARLIPENTDRKDAHTSNLSLSPDGKRMYYTLCEKTGADGNQICHIYFRERKYEGDWAPPRRLPRHINPENYTVTHPTLGLDKTLGKEVLYFVSNRPGGAGGLDIWCSILEKDGTYGNPFPLPFCTPGDDVTPFFHQSSQTLFFSSNGQGGFGGLDIFRVKKIKQDQWSVPENLGYPINSSYDDHYFTFHSGSKRAYFSSNRPGSRCAVAPGSRSCHDVYEAEIFVDMTIWAYDATNDAPLRDVTAELVDKSDAKNIISQHSPEGNALTFSLGLEKVYSLKVSAEGFATTTSEISTTGLAHPAIFSEKFLLRPQLELQVRVLNALDSSVVTGAAVSVQAAGREMPHHPVGSPAREHVFALKPDMEYTVLVSKPGYAAHTGNVVSTKDLGQEGRLHLDLYLYPFDGLPISLYFDNDQPGYVNWWDTVTNVTYEEAYRQYLTRKNDYVTEYSSGLDYREVVAAQLEIKAFFEDKVQASYIRLQAFCNMLESYLAGGRAVEIEVAGYASPLATPAYNRRLVGRRVSSVVNHLKKYNNGSLKRYFDNGQLSVKQVPWSEERAGGTAVSNDREDRRKSVFSPAASELRKVTIMSIGPKQSYQ